MKRSCSRNRVFACMIMLLLILDGKTALDGGRAGLEIVLNTVVPALFPFFFLSILLAGSAGTDPGPLLRCMSYVFRLPASQSHLLVPAFLGGYPAGAQAVSAAWKNGTLSQENAQYLLGFCSNAGPSFLFGIIAAFFPYGWMCWLLWCLHIGGALWAAWVLPRPQIHQAERLTHTSISLPQVLTASLRVLANVCGWLLIARIMLAFLNRWLFWLFPVNVTVLLSGLLELTNGCCMLDQIADLRVRFVLCSMMLSLGGLCVLLQTKSVTEGLSLKWYYQGKIIQTVFCGIMAASVMYRSFLPIVPVLLCIPLQKIKKRSSIPFPAGV